MKTIEELRNELLKIGEKLGGGTRPNHYFFIPDQPDGVATPYLEVHVSLMLKEMFGEKL